MFPPGSYDGPHKTIFVCHLTSLLLAVRAEAYSIELSTRSYH